MTEPSGAVEAVELLQDDLGNRITRYLANGGMFNPELMDHEKVRDLLLDCRTALSIKHNFTPFDQEKRISELEAGLRTASDAINEMFRYFDGGETRGSYDGRPERDQLRKAGYALNALLSPERSPK